MRAQTAAFAILIITMFGTQASAQERRLKRSQLPAAVRRAAAEESQRAKVRGYSTEKENGQTVYEIEMTVNGRSRDVTMDSAGTVLEVEQQVVFDSLPEAVRTGLKQGAGSGRITKVESLTKLGRLVAYEAQVRVGAKRSEVQVGPDGKPLANPQ